VAITGHREAGNVLCAGDLSVSNILTGTMREQGFNVSIRIFVSVSLIGFVLLS
jgi:hypothetical protein